MPLALILAYERDVSLIYEGVEAAQFFYATIEKECKAEVVFMSTYVSEFPTTLGIITMLSNGDALTGLFLPGQKTAMFDIRTYRQKDDLLIFRQTRAYLEAYFRGEKPQEIPLLALKGTAFQQIVWAELLKIPYGTTITYGELAAKVALTRGTTYMSFRAIGHAVGQNPVSLIVPCHRVIGANGKLTGYSGGLELKKKLLKHEGHDLSNFCDK